MALDLQTYRTHEARHEAAQIVDGLPLLDLLPSDAIESLTPLEALALRYSPEAYLRPRQLPPPAGDDWLTWLYMSGRGAGKSWAAAGWIISLILGNTPATPADIAIIGPTMDHVWAFQWRVVKQLFPPWLRLTERVSRSSVLVPDKAVEIFFSSAENSEYRGPSLRAAWLDEPTKYPRGGELFSNLRKSLRVPGVTPPRALLTTNPPQELNWILELCTEPTTRVTLGAMRDNPALDERSVEAEYARLKGTVEGQRELDGHVILGSEHALFSISDLDRYRVRQAPQLEQIVVAVDPAQSAKRDADTVGIICAGIARGHVYVIASLSEKLEPTAWANRALDWAARHNVGWIVVEPTGSGSYPRTTLELCMRVRGGRGFPIVESPARGSKADRAAPLSAACAQGRLHLVGAHEVLERELSTWHPHARWSPGALDALVHAAAKLTNNWTAI